MLLALNGFSQESLICCPRNMMAQGLGSICRNLKDMMMRWRCTRAHGWAMRA